MLVDLLKPVLDVVKSALLRAVVHEHDSHRTLVISLRDRAEPFLASGVPDLKLDSLVLHIDRLNLEVNSCMYKCVSS